MNVGLFAVSWVGICIILVVIYLAIVTLRGIVDFIRWVAEEIADRKAERQRARRADRRES